GRGRGSRRARTGPTRWPDAPPRRAPRGRGGGPPRGRSGLVWLSTCLRAGAAHRHDPVVGGAAPAGARRHGVVAAGVERVAAQDAPRREREALDDAVRLDGLDRVLAAGGVEPAARRGLERREVAPVEPDGGQDDVGDPHATPPRASAVRSEALRSANVASAAEGLAMIMTSKECSPPHSRSSASNASRSRRLTRLRTTALPILRLTTTATLTSPVRVSRRRTVPCLLPDARPFTSRWKSRSDFSDRSLGPRVSDRRPSGACGPSPCGGRSRGGPLGSPCAP